MRAVVIGGGPAGAAAGWSLARRGHEVTILEARAFPRPACCGEYVSPGAAPLLERILPAATLSAHGARSVDRLVLEAGPRRLAWRTARPGWALSRETLDRLLLAAAGAAGCRVIQPGLARSAVCDDAGAEVLLATGQGVRADIVVHADGHGRHDAHGPAALRRGVVALKCHGRARSAPGGVCLRACPGAYVGTLGVEGGVGACALVARASILRAAHAHPDRVLAGLAPELGWQRDGPWVSTGVARAAYRRSGHVRSFRVGNAAGAPEPVGGEGIGLALWSGVRLGELLAEARGDDPGALRTAGAVLAREHRRELRLRGWVCLLTGLALERPALVGAAWPLLGRGGLVAGPWAIATGKGPLAVPRPASR